MDELISNVNRVRSDELDGLVEDIRAAKGRKNIFVYGRGREMMAISAFAVRLNQLGYRAYIVGESHVPPILEGDLFLVTNQRNMLEAHAAQMRVAKAQDARIDVFTAHPDGGFSSIPVNRIIHTYGQTLDDEINFDQYYQTMGTPSEQSLFVLLDCITVKLMELDGVDRELLKDKYTNLI